MMISTEIKEARLDLGLTLSEMALMLGYEGKRDSRERNMYALETGLRKPTPAQVRLLEAYLMGFRPPDWPVDEEEV